MRHHKAMAFYDCLKFINEAVFNVLVIVASVLLASENVITIGMVLTAYLCFTQLTGPLRELHRILDEFSECVVLTNDYFKMVEIPRDFSYEVEEKPMRGGMFLGIAGPSGCGKSSLIKVIDKLESAKGRIRIGGIAIEEFLRSSLSEIVTLVPQTPFLIADTVYYNICYGMKREVSIEEVKEAARKAYIDQVIEQFPGKYEFKISEGGGNLSGGQRQRIALARIFLRKPKLLILDEATSALDNTSEKYIQEQIEKMKTEYGTTIISIAHRLSTLRNCDEIIVMNQGEIVWN